MPRIKLPYREGTLFGVPLEDNTFGIGLVARSGKSGKVFGYFFGPKRQKLPSPKELRLLRPSDSRLVCMFGDLGLIKEWWPVIGDLDTFSRQNWPLPLFSRIDGISGKETLIEYSEDEPLNELRSVRRAPGDGQHYPEDRLCGYRSVEIQLTELFAGQ